MLIRRLAEKTDRPEILTGSATTASDFRSNRNRSHVDTAGGLGNRRCPKTDEASPEIEEQKMASTGAGEEGTGIGIEGEDRDPFRVSAASGIACLGQGEVRPVSVDVGVAKKGVSLILGRLDGSWEEGVDPHATVADTLALADLVGYNLKQF